jgi:hypothetical protein
MLRVLLLCLLLVCGCKKEEAVPMPFDQVPKELVDKAQKDMPDVAFDTARKLSNGNIELRGKNKQGKVREVEFNPAGEIVERE